MPLALWLAALALSVAALLAAATATAGAASRLVIRGHGFGHGIGMSQYGALGFAQHGFGYRDILEHYYANTTVLPLGTEPDVRVLLQTRSRVVVTGAVAANGRKLNARTTYQAVRAAGGRVRLLSMRGRGLGTYGPPLALKAPRDGSLRLRGLAANGLSGGRYRGAIEVRPAGGTLTAVNALDLEDYVRGVVSAESPPSWPAEALKAQAVAARSYAITTNVGTTSDGIDQYADTRSQMYKGVAAEMPSTDAAVAATAREVVAYQGKPVTTFFFSTSGGKTENVEFSFLGSPARSWLRGTDDPYDSVSPLHSWGPITLTPSQVKARLGGLVRGSFRGIRVNERGFSPRIVRAQVLGTHGATSTTGPALRSALGLNDTWATFTYISSAAHRVGSDGQGPQLNGDNGAATVPGPTAQPSGGAAASAARVAHAHRLVLAGRFSGLAAGRSLIVQRRIDGRWHRVGSVAVWRDGRYRVSLPAPGMYRVAHGVVVGPAVTAR